GRCPMLLLLHEGTARDNPSCDPGTGFESAPCGTARGQTLTWRWRGFFEPEARPPTRRARGSKKSCWLSAFAGLCYCSQNGRRQPRRLIPGIGLDLSFGDVFIESRATRGLTPPPAVHCGPLDCGGHLVSVYRSVCVRRIVSGRHHHLYSLGGASRQRDANSLRDRRELPGVWHPHERWRGGLAPAPLWFRTRGIRRSRGLPGVPRWLECGSVSAARRARNTYPTAHAVDNRPARVRNPIVLGGKRSLGADRRYHPVSADGPLGRDGAALSSSGTSAAWTGTCRQ